MEGKGFRVIERPGPKTADVIIDEANAAFNEIKAHREKEKARTQRE